MTQATKTSRTTRASATRKQKPRTPTGQRTSRHSSDEDRGATQDQGFTGQSPRKNAKAVQRAGE